MTTGERDIVNIQEENARLRTEIEALKVIQSEKDAIQLRYLKSQAYFKTIFNESPLGNKIIDEDLRIIRVNKMLLEILGYGEEDLVGRRILEFTPPEFTSAWDKLRKELWRSSNPRTSFHIEVCLIRKDRSHVWCNVTSILFEYDGRQLGYTVVEDITERRENQRVKDELSNKEHLLELKKSEQERQKELFDTVIRAQEGERERIGEQLHDSLGQMLYAVKIHLSQIRPGSAEQENNVKYLANANRLLSESINECRRTSHHLLPRILNDFGLKDALEDLGKQFGSKIKFNLQFEGPGSVKEKYAEILIYRMVQELLLNIIKHADATEVHCRILFEKKAIVLSVSDNGKGFDPTQIGKGGIGLSAMKARIEQKEGLFSISSRPGGGTEVSVELPKAKF